MITQDKFHKLCKYSIRLSKSFISNNSNDYIKYCSHLKYHIGEQIGSGSNPELDRLFDVLTKYINENSDVYNMINIDKKFTDEKNKLEANIETYKIKIKENEDLIEKLNAQTIETKNKLLEADTNEHVIKKLEELHETKYDEFIGLLKKLFTQVYDEEIASNIIEEIGQAETWKDSESKKTKRKQMKVSINGKVYTWNEIINMIELFNTNGSAQLITDIENYLETGIGNVNGLISRYNIELAKSIEKLNAKPKQTQFTNNITIPRLNITG